MHRYIAATIAALAIGATPGAPVSAQVSQGGQAPGTIDWDFAVPINGSAVPSAFTGTGMQSIFSVTVTCAAGSGLSYDAGNNVVAGNVIAKATSPLAPYLSGQSAKLVLSTTVTAFKALASPTYLCFSTPKLNSGATGSLTSTTVSGALPGPSRT